MVVVLYVVISHAAGGWQASFWAKSAEGRGGGRVPRRITPSPPAPLPRGERGERNARGRARDSRRWFRRRVALSGVIRAATIRPPRGGWRVLSPDAANRQRGPAKAAATSRMTWNEHGCGLRRRRLARC